MKNLEPHKLLEEARLLLPWYLTNTLSKAEQSQVSRALEMFPELRTELQQEEKMMRLVQENTSLLELSALDTTEQRLNKMLTRIQRGEQATQVDTVVTRVEPPVSQPKKGAGWLDFLWKKRLFDLDWLTPANAAFAGMLVVQGALLVYTQVQVKPEATFNTAAADNKPVTAGEALEKANFLMSFSADAKHGAVCGFLNQWNARIVSGPDAQNLFNVEMMVGSHADRAALADTIMQQVGKNNSPVLFAGPLYQE